jgi:hypothetical protein
LKRSMKKNKHPKKKAKLFYSVFFQGESISKKKIKKKYVGYILWCAHLICKIYRR